MKLQSKKRKLIKSTENLFRSFTCVDACSARNDATHTANQHREIEHWYIAKIAQKNNHRKRGKKTVLVAGFLLSFMLSVLSMKAYWARSVRSHIAISSIWMRAFVSLLSKNLYSAIGYDGQMRCRHECINRIATSHLATTFTFQSMCACAWLRHINGIVNNFSMFFFSFPTDGFEFFSYDAAYGLFFAHFN